MIVEAIKKRLVILIGAPALALVMVQVPRMEGTILRGYKDPIGIVTACTGHTATAVLGRPYTQQECDKLLMQDLLAHAEPVVACVGPLPNGQMAAAVSFAFNVGAPTFCRSTFARKLKTKAPDACDELSRWVMAGGKDCRHPPSNCAGIVERRRIERDMCLGTMQ